uniref:Serpentine receptor class gamma n=1 Tax=Strongyloides papillosus TaxID=174720 RepID=A0A0N5BCD3_STREA
MFYPPMAEPLWDGFNNTIFVIIYFPCRFCLFQSTYGTFVLSVNRFVSVMFPFQDYHNNRKFLMVFLPFYILLPLAFTWFIIPSTIFLFPIGELFSDNYKISIVSYKRPKFYNGPSVSTSLVPYLLTMGTIQLVLNFITSIKLLLHRLKKNYAKNSNSNTKQEHKLVIFTLITYLFQVCFIVLNKLIEITMYDEDETLSNLLVNVGVKLVILQMAGTNIGLILMSKLLRDKMVDEIRNRKRTTIIIKISSHTH